MEYEGPEDLGAGCYSGLAAGHCRIKSATKDSPDISVTLLQ